MKLNVMIYLLVLINLEITKIALSKIDKELAKISAITGAIEDAKKSYVGTDSASCKNPSDKNTKLTLFFNYILRYNNTENIDDFLKRFEKV